MTFFADICHRKFLSWGLHRTALFLRPRGRLAPQTRRFMQEAKWISPCNDPDFRSALVQAYKTRLFQASNGNQDRPRISVFFFFLFFFPTIRTAATRPAMDMLFASEDELFDTPDSPLSSSTTSLLSLVDYPPPLFGAEPLALGQDAEPSEQLLRRMAREHKPARGRRRARQLATMSAAEKEAERRLRLEKNRQSAKVCVSVRGCVGGLSAK